MKHNSIRENKADIVVIGSGAAGAVAAYKLAKKGLSVILLEKGKSLNDSDFSKISGFMGCETAFQKKRGITVASKENLYNRLTSLGMSGVNHKLIRTLLEYSVEAADILQEMGMHFICFADSIEMEDREKYLDRIDWGPVHIIDEWGSERAELVEKALRKVGVDLVLDCEAKKIIQEGGDKYSVYAICGGNADCKIEASAVFLATGGFGGNKEMMHKFFNGAPVDNLGSAANTGDGIKMAMEVGAVMNNNVGLCCCELSGSNPKLKKYPFDEDYRPVNDNLSFALYGGLCVDSEGERFMNEGLLADIPLSTSGIPALSVGKMYTIMDADYYEKCCEEGVYKCLGEPDWDFGSHLFIPVVDRAKEQFAEAEQQGWGFRAETIRELSEKTGLNNLQKTISKYNDYCEKGKDEEFGKASHFLTPIAEGKGYYAFEYTCGYWCTIGGIKTDAQLRALDANDKPIGGLYIGGTEMGSAFGTTYYDIPANGSGLSIASGALAADKISEYINANVIR